MILRSYTASHHFVRYTRLAAEVLLTHLCSDIEETKICPSHQEFDDLEDADFPIPSFIPTTVTQVQYPQTVVDQMHDGTVCMPHPHGPRSSRETPAKKCTFRPISMIIKHAEGWIANYMQGRIYGPCVAHLNYMF
jgi:hypothetical protein